MLLQMQGMGMGMMGYDHDDEDDEEQEEQEEEGKDGEYEYSSDGDGVGVGVSGVGYDSSDASSVQLDGEEKGSDSSVDNEEWGDLGEDRDDNLAEEIGSVGSSGSV